MKNQTVFTGFQILGFSSNGDKEPLLSIVFFLIYLIGVFGNLVILTVIYRNVQLHTPMYFFLCNLAFVDICYLNVTFPKLIDILLSGNNTITFSQCFIQMFFFVTLAGVEVLLLTSMAYDRYVAICKPLRYHLIMNRRVCELLIVGTWMSGLVNSLICTSLASKLPYCRSNRIKQLFCEIKALAEISCDVTVFFNVIYIDAFLFGLMPFSLNITSYVNIIRSILHVKSSHGRKKAFSTCTSHLTVLIIFYGTVLWLYMRPPSQSKNLDPAFSVLYIGVTPMLNPLIYSLRNKEVKNALVRTVKIKTR
ncbi:hypothetical protein XENTR_v10009649 [Xenopus tropicalis]|nr:hypothetical protein XENTR_v10009649 [Xenopus tropicalis]